MWPRAIGTALLLWGAAGCTAPEAVRQNMTWGVTPDEEPVIARVPKEFKPAVNGLGPDVDLNDRRTKQYGLLPAPGLNAYLNALLDKIKAEAGTPNVQARVVVTASPEPEHQATADGNIYLSQATIRNIRSEAQIMALLAHEYAHILLGHFEVDVMSDMQKQLQTAAAVVTKIEQAAAGNTRTKSGKVVDAKALERLRTSIAITDKVVLPAFKREQERMADGFAIDITRRMGYSYGSGVKSMIEELAALEAAAAKDEEETRQRMVSDAVAAGLADPGAFGAHVKGLFTDVAFGVLSKTHYSTEERLKDISEYHNRFYAAVPRGRDRKENWDKVMASDAVKRVLDNYAAAHEVLPLLAEGRADSAMTRARKAVLKPTSDYGFPNFVLAKAFEARGDRKNARIFARKAMSGPEPSWEAVKLMLELDEREGRPDVGAKSFEAAFIQFGKPPSQQIRLIHAYAKAGNKDKVKAIELECHTKTPNMRQQCTESASTDGWGFGRIVAENHKPVKR